MNLQDEVLRSLIRGAGYRAWRGAPAWVAIAFLALVFILGAK